MNFKKKDFSGNKEKQKQRKTKTMKKKENPFYSLIINIVLPAVIMSKGAKWMGFTAAQSLVIALSFPFLYGIYELLWKKKYNFLSILGFISVLMTGGIGLLELPKEWIAVKEASIPFIISLAFLVSLKTPYPFVRSVVFNAAVLDIQKIETRLKEKGNLDALEPLFSHCTWIISGAFLLSTFLNYFVAKVFIKSETGTQAFTEELGRMTAWSFPIIALPCTLCMAFAMWYFFKNLKKLAGFSRLEELFHISVINEVKPEK